MVHIYPDVCLLTVILLWNEYGDFVEVRQRYHDAEKLRQLFQKSSVTDVFDLFRTVVMNISIALK